MLAAGRSNQASARELVVTLDTAKRHVGHVLGKLGAASRTESVARGPRTELHPWSRAVATPAGSLHSHEGQAPTPGQVAPWCPVLPERFHPAYPLSGDAWPAGSS
jgi:hypothetical protein